MNSKSSLGKTEMELVHGLKNHDVKAFEELFDTFSPVAQVFIDQLNLSDQKNEEVLLGCFTHIFNSIEEFDPSNERLFAWILNKFRYYITTNCPNEFEDFKIQQAGNYVKNDGGLNEPTILWVYLLHGATLEDLSALYGSSKQELINLIRNNIK